MTVPQAWMPAARMERIHVHWTAGGHHANATDKRSYHILIEGDGKLVRADKSIKANERGSRMTPAAHTLSANPGAIGVSMCCMAGAIERPFDAGRSPMTKVQWDTMIDVVADLAKRYGILVTPKTILTHAEVEPNLGIRQRNKWDITRLAFDSSVKGFKAVGDKMRTGVAVALDGTSRRRGTALPASMLPRRFRVAGVAPSALNFRDAPDGVKRGELRENAMVEKLSESGDWWQVRTRGGHVGWVFSSFLGPE
jgi:N-acetylmuramoyl-L-alanine amidase/Bacterial SH3 domain